MKDSSELSHQKTKASLLYPVKMEIRTHRQYMVPRNCPSTVLTSAMIREETGVFSYGSGSAATLYSLKVTQDAAPGSAVDKITASYGILNQSVAQELVWYQMSLLKT